jgi:hypothetical protein
VSVDPFTIALGAGVWLAFLWFREFRTIRTVILLSASFVILLAASALPELPRLALGGLVGTALLAIHFRYHSWILAYTPAEQQFDQSLTSVNERLTKANEAFARTEDRDAFRDALEEALAGIAALEAPGPEWEEVKALAMNLLGERMKIHDRGFVDVKTRFQFRSERAAVHERLRLARVRTARFWRW